MTRWPSRTARPGRVRFHSANTPVPFSTGSRAAAALSCFPLRSIPPVRAGPTSRCGIGSGAKPVSRTSASMTCGTPMASHAVMNGVPVPVVSRLLGHSNVRMTLRYAHLADRDVEAAAERVGSAMARVMAGEAAAPRASTPDPSRTGPMSLVGDGRAKKLRAEAHHDRPRSLACAPRAFAGTSVPAAERARKMKPVVGAVVPSRPTLPIASQRRIRGSRVEKSGLSNLQYVPLYA